MTRVLRRLTIVGLAAALGMLIATAASATSTSAAGSTHAAKFKSPHFVLQARLVIKSDEQQGKKGSDGKWHDAYLPANFTALAGVPVRVTVFNYDDMPHSFTSPGLHLNKIIPAAKGATPGKVVFTFKAKKSGKYLWWCALPCDPWAMSHVGYMRGYVKVVA